jgi:hypothetical protein
MLGASTRAHGPREHRTSPSMEICMQPKHMARIFWAMAGAGMLACTASAAAPPKGTIVMSVTESGFVPDQIRVKKGEPLKLVITRKTDATCAKALVIDEYQVHVDLPLDKPVTVAFTPSKSGQIKYGCAMNKMISGMLIID